MKLGRTIALGIGGLAMLGTGKLITRFQKGRQEADLAWARGHYAPLKDVGAVQNLTITPLIDWYTAADNLEGEAGVAYLVRADETTILFDVGFNLNGEHPSPLLRNMEQMGILLEDIDAVVISHAHPDHLGGVEQVWEHTFSPSGEPVDLEGIPAYVPEPMTHPTAATIEVTDPHVIDPGVVTMGPIARQLFFYGWTPEQSLAVNVAGKGIVLIIGCGHPTIQRIVERAEMLFNEPIYGVVGGLHYPVTASRAVQFGIPMQKLVGTGKWPWDPVSEDDVHEAIAFLQQRDPQLVSLSPHDSCDWSLEAFRQAFGPAYRALRVGEPITVTA